MEAPVHELLADPATRAAALDALEAAPPAGVEAQPSDTQRSSATSYTFLFRQRRLGPFSLKLTFDDVVVEVLSPDDYYGDSDCSDLKSFVVARHRAIEQFARVVVIPFHEWRDLADGPAQVAFLGRKIAGKVGRHLFNMNRGGGGS